MDSRDRQGNQKIIKLYTDITVGNVLSSTAVENVTMSTYKVDYIKTKKLLAKPVLKGKYIVNITEKSSKSKKNRFKSQNKSSINNIDYRGNARFAAIMQWCLNIYSICFNKSEIFTKETIKDIDSYSKDKNNMKDDIKFEGYTIKFATDDIKNDCSVLSNKALSQLNRKILNTLFNTVEYFKNIAKIKKKLPKNLSKKLNDFIKSYNNKNFLPFNFVTKIIIKIELDKIFNFKRFYIAPSFIDTEGCDSYDTIRSIYNQTMILLPNKVVFKSGIFNLNETANYEKIKFFNLSNIFNSKKKIHITTCGVVELLNKYDRQIKKGDYSLVDNVEFKKEIPKKTNVSKNINTYILMGSIIVCVLVGIPLIVGIILYCYRKKRKLDFCHDMTRNEQETNQGDGTSLREM